MQLKKNLEKKATNKPRGISKYLDDNDDDDDDEFSDDDEDFNSEGDKNMNSTDPSKLIDLELV